MTFDEVIGQQEVVAGLIRLVEDNKVPHALMFSGPEGNGKMAVALAFASYLLGEPYHDRSVLDDASHIRNAQAMLHAWQHPDLHFSFPIFRPKGASAGYKPVCDDFLTAWRRLLDKGPYFSMEQWMEVAGADNQQLMIYEAESDALSHKLNMKSVMGGYKVSIVWQPERMNESCANKLLKLLEEPPLGTVFMLVCDAPELLLDTIRSRVRNVEMPRIAPDAMMQALVQRRGLEPDTAQALAHTAEGSWISALSMLDASNENREFLELYKILMRRAFMREIKELKHWSETVSLFGREKQIRLLKFMLRMTRENFMYNFREPAISYMTVDEQAFAQNFSRYVNERNIVEMAELLEQSIMRISHNVNSKMVLFGLTLNMIILLRR